MRIYQPDVYYDKNNWQDELRNVIKKYIYNKITNIFIGDTYHD